MSETLTRPAPVQVSLWTTYTTLLRWQVAQIGPLLPLVVVIQALLAAGIIIGFGFLIPDIDPATALFLSTGAPTVLLLTIGFVIVPQGVARARTDGTFAYMRSLPLARPLLLAADLTVWLLIALPSVAVGVLVAQLRYDLDLSFDWPVLVASALLVTLMATAVGYAIAVSLQPMLAQLVTQVLVFFVLLFSPITFPASQLPGWFQTAHDVLPARPGADLLRAGLASDVFDASGRDLLVLVVWCVLGVAVTLRALVRRE
ncbi:ABC-2 type transport system permease protein [Georgenia satyanarayanai]|uniref:ABC-2 type transport system permease protein n=1 Tax=Georgenia satyanarayanai TaxID=860221 RepID=A0A2Y9C4L9_9MICO|nr:ABC transporter permease [Georgenia satyanarayanai]PYG00452.1 ABC-2 type transport system permease protein [Georgenia satyanarayanai]SSA39833.1 ABC-2 type transport system permease protein [Georgenia satyanarayanai]